VNSKYEGVSAEGRVPPPEEYRIPKGKSGNYKGRPRGTVSRAKLTRKVANTTFPAVIDGTPQRRTLLELLIFKIQSLALSGNAGAAALMNDLCGLAIPPEPPEGCGFLLVPAPVSLEEFMADAEARNAKAVEPGTVVDV
jgi:hypothetical protein